MTQQRPMTRVSRVFHAAMGMICVLLSLAILSKIFRDLFWSSEFAYGRVGVLFQHPIIQTLHVGAAAAMWTAVFLMGVTWILRAKSGLEISVSEK